jgi:excisionase family DNA binding protein
LTVGQLARRWGVGRDHVRQLINDGRLPGVFTIPSAGRYGAAVKIPLASVVQAETEDWVLAPDKQGQARPRPPKRGDDGPALKHFPALAANPEPASGSPGAAPG